MQTFIIFAKYIIVRDLSLFSFIVNEIHVRDFLVLFLVMADSTMPVTMT